MIIIHTEDRIITCFRNDRTTAQSRTIDEKEKKPLSKPFNNNSTPLRRHRAFTTHTA